jgi:hypothetical protein
MQYVQYMRHQRRNQDLYALLFAHTIADGAVIVAIPICRE